MKDMSTGCYYRISACGISSWRLSHTAISFATISILILIIFLVSSSSSLSDTPSNSSDSGSKRTFKGRVAAEGMDRSASNRWKMQMGLVKQKFVEAIQNYQQVEQQYRAKYKQRMEQQFKIVKPDATPNEVKVVVNDDQGGQIFAQAVSFNLPIATASRARPIVMSKSATKTLNELSVLWASWRSSSVICSTYPDHKQGLGPSPGFIRRNSRILGHHGQQVQIVVLRGHLEFSADEQLLEGNLKFRKLIALHTRVTLMADIFSSSTYTHGRASLSLLSGLTGTDASDILPDIGALHRACIWENIVLKSALSARGVNVSRSNPGVPQMATDLSNEVEVGSALPESEQSLDEGKSKEGVKKDGPWERTAKALKHIATQIPTSLTPFFQGGARTLDRSVRLLRSEAMLRRSPYVILSGKDLSTLTKMCSEDDILASYAYWTVMMGLITVLLFEERSNIHMMLIVAFRRVGGLDTLLAICRRYAAAVDRIVQIKTADGSEDDKQQPVHVFGGLKVALHLLHSLVSSKPLFESLQTLLLVTRDMKDTDPEYFEPQDFLVKLRSAVLPFVRELWESPWLVQAPLSVCKSVVLTMLELMAGENEEPKGESAPDVLPTSVGGSNVLHRHVGPDENGIQQLCDMGFPRAAAERALVQMRNNVTAAAEYLLAQPLPFPPDVDPDDANSKDVALDPPASNEPLGVEAEPVVSICDTPTDTEMTAVVDTNVASTRVEPEDTAPEVTVAKTSEQWRIGLGEQ
ncbi:hypothetical protein JB92DRAFT_2835584 [Gautieria morchelliformis]|nr:hypothetical protein JB92DRAFT_2835584 [Gautieria morchelliformis]